MKIAILDYLNQDPGLKILFPEADYYIFEEESFTINYRKELYERRNLCNCSSSVAHFTDIENITSEKYDTLFIVAALYNSCRTWSAKQNTHFNDKVNAFFDVTVDIIKNNHFSNIYFFDNYDYDYDPNSIFIENGLYDFVQQNKIYFFKRYYSREKIYADNVFSFPYIMFGFRSNIDIITSSIAALSPSHTENRLFFAGNIVKHEDPVYGITRNRTTIMSNIHERMGDFLVYKNHLSYDDYMNELKKSRFCLDLHGVGEPNKRTFEILVSGSLRISQKGNLEWNFDDDFAEETYFTDANDLFEKMKCLIMDEDLYKRCLDKQNEIVKKYMSINSMKTYILDIINEIKNENSERN